MVVMSITAVTGRRKDASDAMTESSRSVASSNPSMSVSREHLVADGENSGFHRRHLYATTTESPMAFVTD